MSLKIELTKKECDTFSDIDKLLKSHQYKIQKLNMELNLMIMGVNKLKTNLLKKYKLDESKQYNFDGTTITEIKQNPIAPTKETKVSKAKA